MVTSRQSTAVWAVTPEGARLAGRIAESLCEAQVYVGRSVSDAPANTVHFDRLRDAVAAAFHQHPAHIFVMAAGIAVRMISPHVLSKISDPAVVVADDAGRFAISLLSGHRGGANALAAEVARSIGAVPVITTATDNAGVPAIDLLADQCNLEMENPRAVKAVSMAFLAGSRVWRHDPYHLLNADLDGWTIPAQPGESEIIPGIFIDHEVVKLPEQVLVLRPKSLAVGIGCNRGTSEKEIYEAVVTILEKHRLSLSCIRQFATITDKLAEPGLLAMAKRFGVTLSGYSRDRLSSITSVPNPSAMVEKHMGVKSVCEAAAILGAENGTLVVPKQKSGNLTVAVAAVPCTWSASAPAAFPTCPGGPGR